MLQTATQARMFLNRIAKNYRHLRKWARREGIECFRVYDRDIPELAFALDVYGQHAQLQEYSVPVTDVRAQREWRSAMHASAAQALELPLRNVVLKQRHGQRPQAQYRKLGPRGDDFIVAEGGHRFIVNLTDYLDTGLFLDQRQTRALVQSLAAGRHVLNLFCYSGSFSIYAASGGAKTSTSVDLSNTYLDWARRNFELNGMDAGCHRLVQADARRFVGDEAAAGRRYDLIVLDPPSFSNSKRMRGVLDVQRDHVAMIRDCVEILAAPGDLLFSTNLRSFRLDAAALAGLHVTDISAQTVPADFRNRKIHKCWRICRAEVRGPRAEGNSKAKQRNLEIENRIGARTFR